MISTILTVLLVITVIGIIVAGLRLAYVDGIRTGHGRGRLEIKEYWDKLQRIPIAGQSVDVPGIGAVTILGRGEIEGVPHIDYIPNSVLNGRTVPELDEEELDSNVISCPLEEFVAQCEVSLKFL